VFLVLAGIVHLLPLPGVLGAPALVRLYEVGVDDPNLEILLRHRALLFGLLALLLFAAAARPAWRALAYAGGIASAGSFVVIAMLVGGYGAPIGRVVAADVAVVVLLIAATAMDWRRSRSR
jgi:hypothetical protein